MQTLPFLTPYILSFFLTLFVGVFALRRGRVPGARAFGLMALCQASWVFGFILELLSPSLSGKIFWDDFQWFGGIGWNLFFLLFCIQFTGRRIRNRRIAALLLGIVPMVLVGLILTNGSHGLMHANEVLQPGDPFDALYYEFSSTVYLITLVLYGYFFAGLGMLIGHFRHSGSLLRTQLLIIIIGGLFPIIGTLLTAFGVTFTLYRDTSPFTFAISSLIAAYGLFRQHLFEILPLARRVVLEHVPDVVIVLDPQSRILDMNAAAERAAGKRLADVLGKDVTEVFAPWAELSEQFKDVLDFHNEFSFEYEGQRQYVDLFMTPLMIETSELLGKLIISRNITDRKEAERVLQDTHKELESLVLQRTRELRESEERLKLLASAAFEGIAITEKGRMVDANHQMAAMSGYSIDELRGMEIVKLVHPDDAQMVTEIVRSGNIGPIEHRGVRKDGQVIDLEVRARMQEIDGHTIRVNVMRDVTERNRMLKSERHARLTAEALQAAGQALAQSLHYDEVLETMLKALRRVVPYEGAAVGLLDADKTTVTITNAHGYENWPDLDIVNNLVLPADEHNVAALRETGKSLLIRDTIRYPGWTSFEHSIPIRSWIGVPLFASGEFIGFVGLDSTEPDFFTEEQLALTEAFAGQACVAIENARLYEQTLRRTQELETLSRLSNGLRYAASPDDLFAKMFELTSTELGAKAAVVFVSEADGRYSLILLKEPDSQADVSVPDQLHKQVRELMRSAESQFITEPSLELRLHANWKSYAFLPLQISGGYVSIVAFAWEEIISFSPELRRLLTAIVGVTNNAFDRATAFESLERRVSDRTRELTALYEVTAVASAHSDTATIIDHSLEKILEAVDCSTGMIHLMDETRSQFNLVTQRGLSPDLMPVLESIPAGEEFFNQILTKNEPRVILDAGKMPQILRAVDSQALIGIPIRIGREVRGILTVFMGHTQDFTSGNVSLLMLIIDQMAIALERAELQTQAERAIVIEERQHIARELHDAVTQSLYSLILLVDAAMKLADRQLWARSEHYLRMVRTTAQQVLKEMRLLVYELRPSTLEREGFIDAVRQRMETVENRAGVEFEFTTNQQFEPSSDVQVALYRIVQEALNNALRHAEASSVTVNYVSEKDAGLLEITDNGQGFAPDTVGGGIGISSMRERVEKLGGDFELTSSPGSGTRIRVTWRNTS